MNKSQGRLNQTFETLVSVIVLKKILDLIFVIERSLQVCNSCCCYYYYHYYYYCQAQYDTG